MKFHLSLKFSSFALLKKKSEKYIYITKKAVKIQIHRTPWTAVFSVYFGPTFPVKRSVIFVFVI